MSASTVTFSASTPSSAKVTARASTATTLGRLGLPLKTRPVPEPSRSRRKRGTTGARWAPTVPCVSPDPRRATGRRGEEVAAKLLERQGYVILERNYPHARGRDRPDRSARRRRSCSARSRRWSRAGGPARDRPRRSRRSGRPSACRSAASRGPGSRDQREQGRHAAGTYSASTRSASCCRPQASCCASTTSRALSS